MADSAEGSLESVKKAAGSVIHVFHEQIPTDLPMNLPFVKDAGTAYFIGKDGTDCSIFTDEHVIANDKSVLVDVAQLKGMINQPLEPGDISRKVDVPLDPKRARTTVTLPDGKEVDAVLAAV